MPPGCFVNATASPGRFVRARLQPCRSRRYRRVALAAEVMAIPKRHAHLPGTYFVTSRTWESRHLFVTKPICHIFVEALFHYRDEGAYEVHSFALMPEHFHVLLTPSSSTALERVAQLVKGGSAYRIKKDLKFRFPVWQRGFSDHRIRDAEDSRFMSSTLNKIPSSESWSAPLASIFGHQPAGGTDWTSHLSG